MTFAEYVKIRQEKFGAVIFETLKEKIFVTNKTGKAILNLLNQGYSLDKIIANLTDNYEADMAEIIKNDVVTFINQLKDNNILLNDSSNPITQ
ncbi:MAG: PqqD family protein [Candidatus Omnitrophica bacterium]|nr:PqqD family protein [Candidatus Omnitrophota bacterium]MCM8801669.1 PqqD family protein [Candidatus Omnitrophota bacterium]